MSDKVLISVNLPAYNVGKFIDESIESIINQTENDLEVIVIDDASTDETSEKLLAWTKKNEKIKVFRNNINLKICKSLNLAFEMSSGDFIARIDGDDIALKKRLECQMKYLKEHNLDLVGCQMIAINESGEELSRGCMPIGLDKIIASSKFSSPIAHIWIAKRAVYESLGGYRNIPYAEDYDFILRAIDKGFRCDNTPDHLMLIRQRDGNTASTASLKQRKTHKYVLELQRRRVVNNSDNDGFSEAELERKISSWLLTERLHAISTRIMASAYCDKNKIRQVVKVMLACLFSYYNFEYLLSRSRFKKLFK